MTDPINDVSGFHQSSGRAGLSWAVMAFTLSALGTAGSLYLSIGMGLKACPLCFYQRTFLMGVMAVLLVGLAAGRNPYCRICLLAVPLATGGLVVAAFHEDLVLKNTLECPSGIWGLGPAPLQSLVLHLLLVLALAAGLLAERPGRGRRILSELLPTLVLGAVLGYLCIASAPPLPPAPTQPSPLDTCRPPLRQPS